MRKDFIFSTSLDNRVEDIRFVEEYWSDCWQKEGINTVGENYQGVPFEEEYIAMKPYLDLMPEKARLLDAGCGMGNWTIFLSKQGYDITGLDISETAIAALKSKYPKESFIRGDIRKTDFPNDYFDGVFSWGAFEHFEEGLQPCIKEAWRILKPGGHLFISVPFHNFRIILSDAMKRKKSLKKNRGGLFFQWRFTKQELKVELNIGGFEVLAITPVTISLVIRRLSKKFKINIRPGTSFYGTMKWNVKHLTPIGFYAHMILAIAKKPEK